MFVLCRTVWRVLHVPTDEFVDCFIVGLEKLQVRDFMAKKMQSRFAAKTNGISQPREHLAVADFLKLLCYYSG